MYVHPYALVLLAELWYEESRDQEYSRRRAREEAKDAAPPSRGLRLMARIAALASRVRESRLRPVPTRVPDLA